MNTDRCGAATNEWSVVSVLARVSRAQDDLDHDAYVACFTNVVFLKNAVLIPDWQPGHIAKERLAQLTLEGLAKYDATHHMVFNHVVRVERTRRIVVPM